MKEVFGKYNSAKIFTDVVDENSIAQIKELCDQKFVQGSKIRIMPDVHAGAGCTIGTTMTITDKICPNLVGVDIGCGMHTVLVDGDFDLKKLDEVIHEKIPAGCNVRNEPIVECKMIEKLKCAGNVNIERAKCSIGTLGGGNHFIELDADEYGNKYLVIHSGSRHLGVEVANYYQEAGYKELSYVADKIQSVIKELKAQGRQREIESAIKQIKAEHTMVPKRLAYVEGKLFDDYISDMLKTQFFAEYNRKTIADIIVESMGWTVRGWFETVHNYIDTNSMILRKGAVSASELDVALLIPINMRDGSLICKGKGNPDWNYSAPHGAGRIKSRTAAKNEFSVFDYEKSMSGIYTTSVNESTLDECPMAYKSMKDIVDNIGDTVEIDRVIKPIYNFKASE